MADNRKILSIIGSRTQFIKSGVVSRCLRTNPRIKEICLHTGTRLSNTFFERLNIPVPDYNLGMDLFSPTEPVDPLMEAIEKVIQKDKPDIVLVYSDSAATLAGTLAASRTLTRLAHADSGVRSFTRQLTKERIRILCDHSSDILFTATEGATANLRSEDIEEKHIHKVGDIMFDASCFYAQYLSGQVAVLEQTGLVSGQYALATVHRAENTDAPEKLEQIIRGLASASMVTPILLPLHPRTRQIMERSGLFDIPMHKIHIIDQVSYLDMLCLEKNARIIITDSSGMQKEAYFQGRPCITIREKTEWPELVKAGWNRLVPAESYSISRAVGQAMAAPVPYGARTLFGQGNAGELIADVLARC